MNTSRLGRPRNHVLGIPPVVAAGVSDQLWEIGDIVALIEQAEARARRRRDDLPRNARKL